MKKKKKSQKRLSCVPWLVFYFLNKVAKIITNVCDLETTFFIVYIRLINNKKSNVIFLRVQNVSLLTSGFLDHHMNSE